MKLKIVLVPESLKNKFGKFHFNPSTCSYWSLNEAA